MSVTEQEIKNQIAEMRGALEAVRSSWSRGAVVSVVGVILGFSIVGFFLFAAWEYQVKPLQNYEVWRPVLEQRGNAILDDMKLKDKASPLVQEVAKVYLDEGKKMVEGLKLEEDVNKEVEALIKDIQPILRKETDKAWPEVDRIVRTHVDEFQKDVEKLLDAKIKDRLAKALADQEVTIQQQTGLTEQTLNQLMANLKEASQGAAEKVLMKRVERSMEHIDKINVLLTEIPALPRTMTQDEMVEQLGLALLARVKFELPGPEEVFKPGEELK